MSYKRPTKAVIAAAGFGTRFLPQTKALPKEMLPIIDKPIIQYVVEDLVRAGIKDIIIITGYSKRSIEDHFDVPNYDLINNLRAGGEKKAHLLQEIEEIANLANFVYVRQKGPYGNAAPLNSAQHLIGDEPFIYTFADELIVGEPGRFEQMMTLYEEFGGSIFPCIQASTDEDYARYGIVAGEQVRDGVIKMHAITEKPGKAAAPSNLASVGGYLLTPKLLPRLEASAAALQEGEEFQIQTIMQAMMDEGEPMFACEIQGTYYDTGNKLDYLKTVVDFALKHEDIQEDFREFLRKKAE